MQLNKTEQNQLQWRLVMKSSGGKKKVLLQDDFTGQLSTFLFYFIFYPD